MELKEKINDVKVSDRDYNKLDIAIVIPCYNEGVTISKVVKDYRDILPNAAIYVFDNNSTDNSVQLAKEACATVLYVKRQGKGHVVRAIFERIDADLVVIVDGDDTYLPEEVHSLMEPILRGDADMVVGNRLYAIKEGAMRDLHRFGNRLIVGSINMMFNANFRDILSGYRVISRRLMEFVPLMSKGFEIETELTLQALEADMEIMEVPISYKSRPPDSHSKLRSFRDGYRIMLTASFILRDHYPLRLFGFTGLFCLAIAAAAGILRFIAYIGVEILPITLLVGTMILFAPLGLISIGTGLILNSVTARFRELNQIMRRMIRSHVKS